MSTDLLEERCLYGLPGPTWAEKRFSLITLQFLLKIGGRGRGGMRNCLYGFLSRAADM